MPRRCTTNSRPPDSVALACTSDHRCRLPCCASCAWRFSRHLTERILRVEPRSFLAVEIAPDVGSFPTTAIRNIIDYRRRTGTFAARWRSLGIHLFDCADGRVRGVLTCRGLPVDLVEAFTARWSTTIRVIEPEGVRATIYRVIKPGVIKLSGDRGGYQNVRLSIWPRRERVQPRTSARHHEAMPVLIG
jgi:hypothetical protein